MTNDENKQEGSTGDDVLDSVGAAERRLKEMFEGETLENEETEQAAELITEEVPQEKTDQESGSPRSEASNEDATAYMPQHEVGGDISADDWDETGTHVLTDEERAAQADSFSSLDIDQLNLWFMGIIAGKAWQDMGLIPGANNLILKNLPECQKAIDTIETLFKLSRHSLEEAEQKEIETLITDLKMNFVDQSKTP